MRQDPETESGHAAESDKKQTEQASNILSLRTPLSVYIPVSRNQMPCKQKTGTGSQ